MRLALSEISTVNASFEEDVAAYAAAGFDGIGIWEMKLRADDRASLALLREAGLAVANCVPTIPSILQLELPGMEGPPDPGERIAALRASIRRLAAYEPESVLCLTGPVGDREPTEARALILEGLSEVASAARETGVRLGLEPAEASVSIVATVAETLDLLDEASLTDVGFMADTYHLWHESPDTLAVAAERVTGLHVADPPRESGREDRVLPGDGGTRSAEHVHALAAAGWDGFLDVEIFSTSDRFWGLATDEAASRAHAAVSRLLP
ncbi:MAG: sugar phosphate isomerase/epimerase [Actinobacteria bacterium]|nr:sugar phosphate isomerase/epimerase [Actinomycetota bacterium]